ncbi:MAG: phosphohydrolase [candidate division Zixibacteria bacterium 4484_93]|nr:MAG: phosphohydrolase [candidate division Zixibacteria bacterium 4484_93]RKZ34655.1 MAG: phosphohydrolase [bacterium]
MKQLTIEDIESNPEIRALIIQADKVLEKLGYTEHGIRHAKLVSRGAGQILTDLGYPPRTVELARIAGFLHDIGNVIHRDFHAQSSALISFWMLQKMGMPMAEINPIISAIGNHHEENGLPVNEIAAAVILADKSDVHMSRVRNPNMIKFDIHDRVNYAARRSGVHVDRLAGVIQMEIEIDTSVSSVMEYFEIFLSRMVISRKAAKALGTKFELIINNFTLS